jgi:hypothetical protein
VSNQPLLIDVLTVNTGRKSGVYLEGDVRGDVVYTPLTPTGARQVAASLERAATAAETASKQRGTLH